jgi:hypothetical protein
MPVAPQRLIRRSFEFAPQEEYLTVPPGRVASMSCIGGAVLHVAAVRLVDVSTWSISDSQT